MILAILLSISLVAANYLPSDFLGLARDFSYDITVFNKDRLMFSSTASGIQQFTFYSEGDLTDDLAFYLYGLWTWKEGQRWDKEGSDGKFVLVKTKNRLPTERYDITRIIEGATDLNEAERNILVNLKRYCESLYKLIAGLRQERTHRNSFTCPLNPSVDALLPDIPRLFECTLSRAISPFTDSMDVHLPSISETKSKRRSYLAVPDDFHYTWQQPNANKTVETLTLSYARGAFKIIMDSAFEDFTQIIAAIRQGAASKASNLPFK